MTSHVSGRDVIRHCLSISLLPLVTTCDLVILLKLLCASGCSFLANCISIRARATSAAPPYFKSFCPKQSNREFVDGAVYHNNPIIVADAERKYIWPDVDTLPPDLLLSIGTGRSSQHLKAEEEKLEKQKEGIDWSKLMPKMFKVVFATMNDVLNAEKIWRKYQERLTNDGTSKRYIRINVELHSAPPALDEKKKVPNLELETRSKLQYMDATIQIVADRLIASCFYFDKANVQPIEGQTGFVINGT